MKPRGNPRPDRGIPRRDDRARGTRGGSPPRSAPTRRRPPSRGSRSSTPVMRRRPSRPTATTPSRAASPSVWRPSGPARTSSAHSKNASARPRAAAALSRRPPSLVPFLVAAGILLAIAAMVLTRTSRTTPVVEQVRHEAPLPEPEAPKEELPKLPPPRAAGARAEIRGTQDPHRADAGPGRHAGRAQGRAAAFGSRETEDRAQPGGPRRRRREARPDRRRGPHRRQAREGWPGSGRRGSALHRAGEEPRGP